MNEKKYSEAIQILNAIIVQDKSVNQIFSLFWKCRCEIETSNEVEATCKEIASRMASNAFKRKNQDFKGNCFDEVESLVKKLIKVKKFDESLLLLRSQFNLINESYSDDEKIIKLRDLGNPIKSLAENFNIKTNEIKIKECYLLLDEILHEMQMMSIVNLDEKTKNIAWFMHYYGYCCNVMKDFAKSQYIYSHVLFHMKSIHGKEACHFRVYGICHHNFGSALKNLNRLKEAKQKFEEALKSYEQAKDWRDDEHKLKETSLTIRVLHETITELRSQTSI